MEFAQAMSHFAVLVTALVLLCHAGNSEQLFGQLR
jgi:hypothetical protein